MSGDIYDRAAMERGAAAARELTGKGPSAGDTHAALDDRQQQIMGSKHAKGRHRELAAHLAHKTDLPAADAGKVMDAAELDAQREDRGRGE